MSKKDRKEDRRKRTEDAVINAVWWILYVAFIVAAGLTVILPITAHAENDPMKWTTSDTALQAVVLAEFAVDRAQTAEGHQRNYLEHGWAEPFIGEHPTHNHINEYFAASAILHTAVSVILPKPYRTFWQAFFIAVESDSIGHNANIGLSVRF